MYVPNLATIADPLRELTRKDVRYEWSSERDQAFKKIKAELSSNLINHIFDPQYPVTVTTDASGVGLGAVLSQTKNGVEVAIEFASHTLSETERRYATNEREALAIVWALEHWENLLFGRRFMLMTDHSGLQLLMQKHTASRQTSKFSRWLERISAFDYTIKYKRGSQNHVADALSRLVEESIPGHDIDNRFHFGKPVTIGKLHDAGTNMDEIIMQTKLDPLLQRVMGYVRNSWPDKKIIDILLRPFFIVRNELSIENGYLLRDNRIVVPANRRSWILVGAHQGHQGIVRTKRLIRESYWWPNVDSEIEEFVRYCLPCQSSGKR